VSDGPAWKYGIEVIPPKDGHLQLEIRRIRLSADLPLIAGQLRYVRLIAAAINGPRYVWAAGVLWPTFMSANGEPVMLAAIIYRSRSVRLQRGHQLPADILCVSAATCERAARDALLQARPGAGNLGETRQPAA
jgi:hypothetical protein